MHRQNRTVLVVGMGTSPAVLTETVWALAHSKEPVVPDKIEVITTKLGKAALTKAVLDGSPSVMDRLKAALRKEKIDVEGKLVFGTASIKVIPDAKGNELDDLRTGEDNLRAADFMLGELRKYSECNDTTIHCSIAGGRKTMSALLFSCMSLVGREQDKVYHVLIPPEYECGMEPAFFFPEKGKKHELLSRGKLTGKKVPSTKVEIELFEVPYVRMRGWYQEKFKTMPPTYRTLVSRIQSVAPMAMVRQNISIDVWNGRIVIDEKDLKLSNTCLAAFILLARRCPGSDLRDRLVELHRKGYGSKCEWISDFNEGSRFHPTKENDCQGDLSKVLTDLRNALESIGFIGVEALVPMRRRPVTYPTESIKWINCSKIPDVRGCLLLEDM